MIALTRTVRFCVSPGDDPAEPRVRGPNGYAGLPAMRGLGRYYELDVTCRGLADPVTGYFINIKDIDAAARAVALPEIARACLGADSSPQGPEPAAVLEAVLPGLLSALKGSVERVRWRLSPFYSVEVDVKKSGKAVVRQRFEFAAAHRLHVTTLSDAENRALFGKCNNPSGHGHNYVVEPAVEVGINGGGQRGARTFTLTDLEAAVEEAVLRPFDHTHLNADTRAFGPGGLNPSVENIAKVCFEALRPVVEQRAVGLVGGARLLAVTVWETEKTSATWSEGDEGGSGR